MRSEGRVCDVTPGTKADRDIADVEGLARRTAGLVARDDLDVQARLRDAFDPSGRGSVAILRDLNTKAQHRVRVGTLLGRMRVARIQPKAVVFTVEELGFSRQETLSLNDSTAVRSK